MCVIVYKPRGIQVSVKTLEKMWKKNSDGGGLAYIEGGKVVYNKGFMDKQAFFDEILKHQHRDLVFHMRIATHGRVCPENTHPFPITLDDNALSTTKGTADAVLFHNGVISGYGDKENITDTADFMKQIIARTPDLKLRTKICDLTSSRFVLMQDGEIWMVGNFEKIKGLQCSNDLWDTSYETIGAWTPAKRSKSPSHPTSWDWGECEVCGERRVMYDAVIGGVTKNVCSKCLVDADEEIEYDSDLSECEFCGNMDVLMKICYCGQDVWVCANCCRRSKGLNRCGRVDWK